MLVGLSSRRWSSFVDVARDDAAEVAHEFLAADAWRCVPQVGVDAAKVMGTNVAGFAEAIVAIAQQFDPAYDPATLERRPSKAGNFIGLTITVTATSREQLDALYRALTGHPMVKMVL